MEDFERLVALAQRFELCVVVKFDAERPVKKYTVVVSGSSLSVPPFRQDGPELRLLTQSALLFLATAFRAGSE